MDDRDDGGPAFPEAVAVTGMGDVIDGRAGMTLRDYAEIEFIKAALRTGSGPNLLGAVPVGKAIAAEWLRLREPKA